MRAAGDSEGHEDCLAHPELGKACAASGNAPDPNAPIPLCRECVEEHHANWDAAWAEYYAGLL